MLKQKCEISSNFVPDVKQIIWRWLVGMHLRYISTYDISVLCASTSRDVSDQLRAHAKGPYRVRESPGTGL